MPASYFWPSTRLLGDLKMCPLKLARYHGQVSAFCMGNPEYDGWAAQMPWHWKNELLLIHWD